MATDPNYSHTKIASHSMPKDDVEEPDFQIATVWPILRGHVWLIAALGVIGLGLAIVASSFMSKEYSATTTIEVNKQADSSVGVSNLTGTPQQFGSSDEMTASLLTQVAELQSATVGLRVIDHLGLVSSPPYSLVVKGPTPASQAQQKLLELFGTHLQVALVKDTKLIQVTFSDLDPKRAAAVANDVVSAYIQSYSESRGQASGGTTKHLEDQLSALEREALKSQQDVNAYKARTGIVGEDTGAAGANPTADSVVANRFVALNNELTAAEVARVSKEAMVESTSAKDVDVVLGALSSNQGGGPDNETASSINTDFSQLSALRQQQSQLALQVASRSNTFGAKSPQMLELQSETSEINRQITEELNRIRLHARSALRLAHMTENGLRSLVKEQQGKVAELSSESNQLRFLQQQANSERALYQDLYGKLQAAKVSSNVDSPTISIIDPARVPIAPSSPKIGRNLATGFIIGMLLGVLIAFLRDSRSRPVMRGQPVLLVLCLAAAMTPGQMSAQIYPSIPANLEQLPTNAGRGAPSSQPGLSSVPEDIGRAPLQPGYLVHLQIYGVPDMSWEIRVDEKGNLTIPFVGTVAVAGLGISAAQAKIAEVFVAREILKNPQVTLNVLQYSTLSVTVLGEVQNPGRLQLPGPATLEDVVALAGGETSFASGTIQVQQQGSSPYSVPYTRDGSSEPLRRVSVHSGDSIYVRRAGVVYVMGAVTRPGGYVMVNGGELNVLQAVSLASGTTLIASIGTVYVIRPGDDKTYKTIPIRYKDMERGKELPITLQANDILFVPTSKTKAVLIDGAGLVGAAATSAVYAYRTP